jgi:hypothetical protein
MQLRTRRELGKRCEGWKASALRHRNNPTKTP